MTHCPRCHRKLDRARELGESQIGPGRVVLACRGPGSCDQFAVEVQGAELAWIPGGEGWLERLKATVEHQETVQQILESDGDDPRWQRMMV